MTTTTGETPGRGNDLRARLVAEAAALAETGGPDAIVLREVARRAGVSATAAYRYFEDHDSLREQVRVDAMRTLFDALREGFAAAAGGPASGTLASIGQAYVSWARANPGLFRTAFEHPTDAGPVAKPDEPDSARQLLTDAVQALVDTGELPPERQPFADEAAWSAVHGVAMLLISGPLRWLPADAQDSIVDRVLDMIIRGL